MILEVLKNSLKFKSISPELLKRINISFPSMVRLIPGFRTESVIFVERREKMNKINNAAKKRICI